MYDDRQVEPRTPEIALECSCSNVNDERRRERPQKPRAESRRRNATMVPSGDHRGANPRVASARKTLAWLLTRLDPPGKLIAAGNDAAPE
jgi:hypothetical protein